MTPSLDTLCHSQFDCRLDNPTLLKAITNLCEATDSGLLLHSANGTEIFRFSSLRTRQAQHQVTSILVHHLERIGTVKLNVIDPDKADAIMMCVKQIIESSLDQDVTSENNENHHFRDILNAAPIAISYINGQTRNVEFINPMFQEVFGYSLDDIPTMDDWLERAYPDESFRNNIIASRSQKIADYRTLGLPVPDIRTHVVCRDGSTRQVLQRVRWLGEHRVTSYMDLSALSETENRMQTRYGMLEMLLTNATLDEVLISIVRRIENNINTGSRCSVLLLDKTHTSFEKSYAPSLPKNYNDAIIGVQIGLGVGSCGTAAYLGKRVIVEDIMTNEYWRDFTALAQLAGVQSCWSQPILNSAGDVLGTFAIYNDTPSSPNNDDIDLIGFAARLAAIAIENRSTQLDLENWAFSDHLTGLVNRRRFFELAERSLVESYQQHIPMSVVILDVDRFKKINDQFGHIVGDNVLKALAKCSKHVIGNQGVVGRLGGEEFTILLPESNLLQATSIAESLRQELAKLSTPDGSEDIVKFTVSCGVSSNDDLEISLDELVSRADHALYQAKRNGRNCVIAYQQPE
ncbi:sensor domain-containing diguanylate cyclase [Marinomonas balearica]|uniref:diguanylate cyclase n=1 Tax=Marinomonas balearica TaxID=491947 RepID=A0A4R6MI56_9GAMM|nr:diguanylate cyclase [Marinomonas balearica]TDP01267.1 diguanylate cyclase (GGDEF)-like protein [Marinomonas balearica]